MLRSISQTRNNMFKARCAKKVHSDDVLHEKTTCWGHFAGKRRRIQISCQEECQVERRFSEERASFGRFRSQETVWSQRVTVGIACCRCLTGEKWYI